MDKTKAVTIIKDAVEKAAEAARYDAGMSGRWDDGGAGMREEQLKYWLDGIKFAETGKTKMYANILKEAEKKVDPEYETYLRLQAKFEKGE